MTDYGFVRVSSGSQDSSTQETSILRVSPGAVIIRPDTKSASASKGEQLDALDAVIVKLRKGDRVIVTDSSRLDRRDNLTSQVETMLAIRKTGAAIMSLAPGEETFANGDDLGSWVTTLVKQNANAEKSRTVKAQTYRGVSEIIANRAHYGPLPVFWGASGGRYGKQAACLNPDAVRDLYRRVATGESLAAISRSLTTKTGKQMYPESLKLLIKFPANHTGVIECTYTHDGVTDTWGHVVAPVVESELWWRANRVLKDNLTKDRANRGGRPIGDPANWLSGVLDCPNCGGRLFINTGKTGSGNLRTPKLRCCGHPRDRRACGVYKPVEAAPIVQALGDMFGNTDDTEILAFQRVAGNAHELEGMKAELSKLQARLGVTEDDDELDKLVAERKAIKARIEGFEIIPDSFDYAETGQTVATMWNDGDDTVKRSMSLAVKNAGALIFDGTSLRMIFPAQLGDGGIVDLGSGLCFRHQAPKMLAGIVTEHA